MGYLEELKKNEYNKWLDDLDKENKEYFIESRSNLDIPRALADSWRAMMNAGISGDDLNFTEEMIVDSVKGSWDDDATAIADRENKVFICKDATGALVKI